MIEHLIHAALHKLAEDSVEKLTEESGGTATQKVAEKEKKEIEEQKMKILQDCRRAVLLCSKNKSATLQTKKWDCEIDYPLLVDTLVAWGYPKLWVLDIKTVASWEPVSFLAKCISDRICDKWKI